MSMMLLYIVVFLLMIFWMNRSNKKRQQAEIHTRDSLAPGMYIMLKDGFFGTVVDIDGDQMVVNLSVDGADEGCVTLEKSSLSTIVEQAGAGEAPVIAGPGMSIAERIELAKNAPEPPDDHWGEELPEVTESTEEDAASGGAETDDTEASESEADEPQAESEEAPVQEMGVDVQEEPAAAGEVGDEAPAAGDTEATAEDTEKS